MRTLVFILFLMNVYSGFAQLNPLNIDGSITLTEQRDTTGSKIYPIQNEDFLIRSDRQYIYIGIHSRTSGSHNVILNKEDEFIVIHLSGCTGRAIYKQIETDSLKLVRPIFYLTEHPEQWDVVGVQSSRAALKKEKTRTQQRKEMEQCMAKHGYMGTTSDMGSYREAEVLLDKEKFRGYKLLIQNNEEVIQVEGKSRVKRGFFPVNGIENDPKIVGKFLLAEPNTSLRILFDLQKWIDLRTL